jgi:hypothetical protein
MQLNELPLLKSMRPIVAMPESTELELPPVRLPQIKELPPNVKLPVKPKNVEVPKDGRLPESVVRAVQRLPVLPKQPAGAPRKPEQPPAARFLSRTPNRPALRIRQPAQRVPAPQPLPANENKDNRPGIVPLPTKPVQRAQEVLQRRPIMPTRQVTPQEGAKKDVVLQPRPQPVRIEGTLRLESDRSATITGTLLGGVPGS